MPIIDRDVLIRPEPDEIIWRYLDLEKFEKLLSQRSLFFCRSDKFSDPFEGSLPKREVEHRPNWDKAAARSLGRDISHAESIQRSQQLAELHIALKRSFVVNCWHINQGESDAMWRLYLKTNEGVAVQSKVSLLRRALENSAENVLISKIRYLDYEKDIWYDEIEYPVKSYNLYSPIIHKRKAFHHENELRLFLSIEDAQGNRNYWENQSCSLGILIKADIEILIEKIILPPTSDADVKRKVDDLLCKYGLSKETEKSKLNDEPMY